MAIFGFGFWRKVAKNPDLALALLAREPDVILDETKQKGYAGPFFFVSSIGRHKVYIRHTALDEVQKRVGQQLG